MRRALRQCLSDGVKPSKKNLFKRMADYTDDEVGELEMKNLDYWLGPKAKSYSDFALTKTEDDGYLVYDKTHGLEWESEEQV